MTTLSWERVCCVWAEAKRRSSRADRYAARVMLDTDARARSAIDGARRDNRDVRFWSAIASR
jgi:hypothetical protein